MGSMSFSNFKLDKAGVAEISKSAGVQAILREHAESLASNANTIAHSHKSGLHISDFEVEPYAADVDVLNYTAVGAVHTNGKIGQIDHAKYSTLNAINH